MSRINSFPSLIRRSVTKRSAAALAASAIGAAGFLTLPSSRPHDSLIVLAKPGQVAAAEQAVRAMGGSVGLSLPSLHGFSATVDSADTSAVGAIPSVLAVAPNEVVHLASDSTSSYDASSDPHSLANLEADMGVRSAWSQTTGTGVGVALIDSGVTTVAGLDNPGQVIVGPDITPEAANPNTDGVDTFGHGTFLAGIIAGHDNNVPVSASDNSDFLGVAPNAHIVSVKVADRDGTTSAAQVVAGIEWVVDHAKDPGLNIKVLNLSLGADPYATSEVDPMIVAVDAAWYSGITVVVSAGNGGTTAGKLAAPAIDPTVIAVGAGDPAGTNLRDGTVAPFSSVGNGYRNPDVVAPGMHVQSLTDPGSYVAENFASTGQIDDRFFRGSGTSEAAAFVSGEAALLLQAHPDWTPAMVKAALDATAVKLADATPAAAGNGAVNILSALTATNLQVPASENVVLGRAAIQASVDNLLNQAAARGDKKMVARPTGTDGSSWSGSSWSGSSWSGSSWSGSSWSGSSWSGSSWSGSSWSGSSWSSDVWASSRWK